MVGGGKKAIHAEKLRESTIFLLRHANRPYQWDH